MDAAVNAVLVSDLFHTPLPGNIRSQQNEKEEHSMDEHDEDAVSISSVPGYQLTDGVDDGCASVNDLEVAGIMYDNLLDGKTSVTEVCESSVLINITKKLEEKTRSLGDSRGAGLWLQFMRMMDILRKFLKAERTGNWLLHIQAQHDMLPYLAAAGHNLYTKSLHVYLQNIDSLREQHPEVFSHFCQGLHVVRRTNRFWAGLSPDLVIEQVLMRSMKTSGGLTRGRGMAETQRLVWLMSHPICSEVNNSIQELTEVCIPRANNTNKKRNPDKKGICLTHVNWSSFSIPETHFAETYGILRPVLTPTRQ